MYVNKKQDWLRWIAPEEFNDKDLFTIVTFFVFHSPCKGLSSMSRTLEEYGWKSPWKKPFYLNKQLKEMSDNYIILSSARKYDDMHQAAKKAKLDGNFTDDLKTERICVNDNEKNQFMSVFYHIRNAFAHGRLNMINVEGECIFIMEDICPEKNTDKVKLSARIVIKKKTLLSWISLIEAGEQEYANCKYK